MWKRCFGLTTGPGWDGSSRLSSARLARGIARLMIRPEPLSSGSGVQHVEAVMHGEVRLASLLVVPIKFIGGWIGIGTGLALGREGPTIQMGATIGAHLAKHFRCAADALKDLQAALGGAGLAVAFNAPVGGALFVFEEVARAFRLRLTIVVLLGTATAIGVCRAILGNTPDFHVTALSSGPQWELVLYCLLGGALGLLGVLYNRTTVLCLDAFDRVKSLPPEVRAAIVGAIVGLVAWFLPTFTGGGDALRSKRSAGAFLSEHFCSFLSCVGFLAHSAIRQERREEFSPPSSWSERCSARCSPSGSISFCRKARRFLP